MQTDGHLLAHVLEYTPIGILILREDMTVVFVNQYALDLFRCDKEDMLGETVETLAALLKDKVDGAAIAEMIRDETLRDYTQRLSFDDRPDIVCMLNSFHIDGIDPYPDCSVLVIRDITKEREAADMIKAKNVEIAKINTYLFRSNSELKKVSELKSKFLNIASHELNTPLTSIKGYSDIIIDNMKDKVEPSIFRMIESISRAADRLHKAVNNILEVTKIEQGRLRLRPEKIDLGALILDCIDDISQIAEKRGIVFSASGTEGLPEWSGDRSRLNQMFTNLFNNAVKYSPDNSTVEVGIETEENHFHITVRDHGIGIDKSEHKNIFDAFYEVASASRHSTDASKFMGGGSGLGLSIVKGIVERHGGRIWVESEGMREGAFPGSAFHIVLPLRSGISWDDDETRSSENSDDIDDDFDDAFDDDDAKPVILFIDPDKESIEIASTALENTENVYNILTADSGEQGLIIAFNQKPSLILIDSRLPGLDGYRICRILRSQEETRNIPIVFFSAGARDDEIQKCFACGAVDFIVKPFSGLELMTKICGLLKKRETEGAEDRRQVARDR